MGEATTKCYNCYYPLGIYDLKRSEWKFEVEEFTFICPSCGKENKIMSRIFRDSHIARNYLVLFKENRDYLPEEQQKLIIEHLNCCEICSATMNDLLLNEVEEKVNFSHESIKYFDRQATMIMKDISEEVEIEGNRIKSFYYNDQKFKLTDECEIRRFDFFLDEDKQMKAERIHYFIYNDYLTIGIVSFVLYGNKVILEKIWIKSKNAIIHEKNLINDFKNHRLDVSLTTLKKISKKVNF